MDTKQTYLVTGANGHLGYNLVKELIGTGQNVIASIRNPKHVSLFDALDCEVVQADMLDKQALLDTFQGVDQVFHCAAAFKHWAKDPEKEILEVNRLGTQNILEAAAKAGIKRLVYVSSIAALDHAILPMDEQSWSTVFPNPYYQAKLEAEKLAWHLADELNVDMVTVLPSSMIGSELPAALTPTMNFLNLIAKGQLPFDPNFSFNYVDVKDVAKGMILAAEKGRRGQRYILATKDSISTSEVIELSKGIVPNADYPVMPKAKLLEIAKQMEEESQVTGQAPLLLVKNVEFFYQADARIDISKAQKELGYDPKPPRQALLESLEYLGKR